MKDFIRNIVYLVFISLWTTSGAYPQITPPGGIGNSSNIIMWLSPDTAIYNNSGNAAANGEDIFEWHDISNNNVVFSNTNASRRPSLSAYNGQNFLDFTPGDFLENTVIKDVINGLNEFSIFVVVKSDVINTDNGFLDSENPNEADDKICMRYDVDGANTGRVNVIKSGLQGNTPNNQIETTSNVQTTNIQVIAITWKSGESLKSYINGVANELSPSNVTGPISNILKIIVGKGPKDGGAGEGWDGRIGTVIFYNHQFPADTVATVSNSASLTAGTIGSGQIICSGTIPSGLTNTSSPTGGNGSYSYQWQSSSDNSVWSTIAGATSPTYSPGVLSSSTYYRRKVTSGNSTKSSASVLISVNPSPSPAITAGGPTDFCSGCSVTLTSSPASSYSWSNGATSSAINVTTSGSYTVTVTDINGCQGTSAATNVTVSNCGSSHEWTGSTSSDWNTISNWNKCVIPNSTHNVVIQNTATSPLVTGSANAHNLTLQPGAVLTISSSGSLNAEGNIINNGTISGTGELILNGTSIQNITGSGANSSNLTLDNAAGCNVNSPVTLSGVLTLTKGQLRANNNLTIDLNAGAISGTGAGTISGNVTLQKTVNSNKYHYISTPLSGLTVDEWNDDVEVKFGQYKNLYTYNEDYTDTSKAVGWDPVSSLTTPLVSLKGYAMYYYGPTTMDVTGPYVHSATFSDAGLTNTISGNSGSDGWNLVGNPYPSTLDWDAASGWTKTNLDGAIYLWDPVNNRYASYVGGAGTNGGTQYIPSMQAFWVRVNAAGGTGTLTMNNNVRTDAPNPSIWRMASSANILKLTASSDGFSDETVIRFMEDAEETFDSHADAYKKSNSGNTPSIFTETGGINYSINSLPDDITEKIIPVKLKAGFTGTYTISVEEMGDFGSEYTIMFEDRLLAVNQDLRSNPSYTCHVEAGDTTGRFYLNFRKASVNSVISASNTASILIRGAAQTVTINFKNISAGNATIMISDVIGKEKFFIENADIGSGEYSIVLPPTITAGIYIVKVSTPAASKSGRVYLND